MAKEKTVVLFVRHTNEAEGIDNIFTESTEVGKNHPDKTPSQFIKAYAKLYKNCNGNDKFRIVDVRIG